LAISRTKAQPAPDPRLEFDPFAAGLKEFPRDFFRQETVIVAKAVMGALFARRYEGRWYAARIIETEAYLGSGDAAAHSWKGRKTPRVEPMYMDGGHLYVFLVYGMHSCANIVTRPEGVAEAVLLRAAEVPSGGDAKLMSGPGKLCAALGVTVALTGADLLGNEDLRLFQGDGRPVRIGTSKRIGVEYAGAAADWPLRFYDIDSGAVSGPRHLRSSHR
jgi:DNA-3-methyladenine glycosylase